MQTRSKTSIKSAVPMTVQPVVNNSDETPETKQTKYPMAGVLYTSCYGGFRFSDKFLDEYHRRHGVQINNCDSMQTRSDPKIIKLYEEMGPQQSSGFCAWIKIKYVPEEVLRASFIEEYDGMENVFMNYDAIYRILIDDYMNGVQHDEIVTRYNMIKKIEAEFSLDRINIVI